MRNLHELDQWRDVGPEVVKFYGHTGDHAAGAFIVPSPIDKANMRVVASADMGWDHVSVSRRNRCPNWTEMEFVKRSFFRDDEYAMQLHIPPSEHINFHSNCLHIWRPHDMPIPLPPSIFVGPKA
jgi:hypothetical protein